MPARFYSASTTADTSLVTTAETVVATLAGVSTASPGESLDFSGALVLTTGANTTGVTLRVRQDGLTGALVGEAQADTLFGAAGSVETHTISTTHVNPGEFSGKTYVLTVQQVGATTNGNVTSASLRAHVR